MKAEYLLWAHGSFCTKLGPRAGLLPRGWREQRRGGEQRGGVTALTATAPAVRTQSPFLPEAKSAQCGYVPQAPSSLLDQVLS